MTTSFDREPGAGLADDELPGYACMLHAYHRARAANLRAIIATLPIAPGSLVLDVACGDACYSIWLAEHAARVVGIDLSPAYLDLARRGAADSLPAGRISFERADVMALPFEDGSFDLTWLAQSLFSLPEPLGVLREMIRVTRPGGHVAILENDTLHHLLLPWPAELELAVRRAQMATLAASACHPFILSRPGTRASPTPPSPRDRLSRRARSRDAPAGSLPARCVRHQRRS